MAQGSYADIARMYAEKVVAGEILACKWVKAACQRQLSDLKKYKGIREGYTRFKAEKNAKALADIATKHGLATAALQAFVNGILDRMIFDGEQLSDLMAPLDLGWKARSQAETALMKDLHPLLTQRAGEGVATHGR